MRRSSWLLYALIFAAPAFCATTDTVAFQGRVTSGNGVAVPDAYYKMSFSLYTAPTEGGSLWTETNLAVPVARGLFTTQLGEIEPFPAEIFDNASLYLEIAIDINNNGLDSGDIQVPRTPLNAVPVAFHARDSGLLNGKLSTDFATASDLSSLQSTVLTQADAITDLDTTQGQQDAAIASKAESAALATKFDTQGESYVVVKNGNDILQNGLNLIAAYEEAKQITPHGSPRSASNRVVVILVPGIYDLGINELALDAEFIDLIGLSTRREAQYVRGLSNGPGTGVITQSANDVGIENLRVGCTRVAGSVAGDATDPAAYFPASGLSATSIKNCAFEANGTNALGMRSHIEYSGTYTDCSSPTTSSFGGFGIASGTFLRCNAGPNSFGGGGGAAAVASGRFTDCSAGSNSFGGGSGATASGIFVNCIAGNSSFGGNAAGTSVGAKLLRCHMQGNVWPGTFRGRMEDCRWDTAIILGAEARVYNSTILGNVDLGDSAAGIAQSRVKGTLLNVGSASFNTGNLADVDVN